MQRIVAGEQNTFRELYQRYDLLLRKIIGEKLCNAFDTEEVLQDVFIMVWNRAGNYDPAHGKALGWVICMARRRAVDHLRRNRRHRVNRVSWDWDVDESDGLENPPLYSLPAQESLVATWDLRQRLAELIGELPAEQQYVLELAYFDAMSHRRIAASTGIPLGTIKTRLELAIKKLIRKSEHFRGDL